MSARPRTKYRKPPSVGLRLKAAPEIITPIDAPFPVAAPSCLGAAHRRCTLTAAECCCPCHVDGGATVRAQAEAILARPRLGYTCAVCGLESPSALERREHVAQEHPVRVRQSNHGSDTDDETPDRFPTPTARAVADRADAARPTIVCPICDLDGFTTERSLGWHLTLAHRDWTET